MRLSFSNALSLIRNMFYALSLAVVIYNFSLSMKNYNKEILRLIAILLMSYSIGMGFLVLFNSMFYEENKIFLSHNIVTLAVIVITGGFLLRIVMTSESELFQGNCHSRVL